MKLMSNRLPRIYIPRRRKIMNYGGSVFKEKANRRARRIWIIFVALLSANYGADVANHLRGTVCVLGCKLADNCDTASDCITCLF